MQKRLLVIALIAFALVATGFAKKKPATPTEASSIEQALSAEKPAAVLFHNSKACKCTLTKCVSSLGIFQEAIEAAPGNYSYLAVDLSVATDLAQKYEAWAIPIVVFFDANGAETSRLRVNEITAEGLQTKLNEIAKESNKKKQK